MRLLQGYLVDCWQDRAVKPKWAEQEVGQMCRVVGVRLFQAEAGSSEMGVGWLQVGGELC